MRLAHHIPAKGLVGAIPGNAVRVIDAPYRGLDSQPRQSMATQSPISQRFTPRVITFAQKPWLYARRKCLIIYGWFVQIGRPTIG
jgi:hypothetical protein